MDIISHAELVLRNARYATRISMTGLGTVLCFEDQGVLGFVQVFPGPELLLSSWNSAEKAYLARYAPQLKAAPVKAWNIYSVFLTEAPVPKDKADEIDRIEEDLTFTRKIVRGGIVTAADLERALLPLLALQSVSTFSVSDYESKIRSRLGFLNREAVEAILGAAEAADVARIVIERS